MIKYGILALVLFSFFTYKKEKNICSTTIAKDINIRILITWWPCLSEGTNMTLHNIFNIQGYTISLITSSYFDQSSYFIVLYCLRKNTQRQRTFQVLEVGSRFPMVNDGCWWCLILPHLQEISWICRVEIVNDYCQNRGQHRYVVLPPVICKTCCLPHVMNDTIKTKHDWFGGQNHCQI